MSRLKTLKQKALKALLALPMLENRWLICHVVDTYMPSKLDAFSPIGDPDGESFLFLNLSNHGSKIHVHLTGLEGLAIPKEDEPIVMWLCIDDECTVSLQESKNGFGIIG